MAEEVFKSLMYGDMLNTPGFDVEFAVGLTYSLDFDALMSIPMSFGLLGDSEDLVKKSPAYLLAAIRKSSDKMAVFCNNGSIKAPKECRIIYSLLESSVFPVKQIGNFHPKLWIVQEVDKAGKRQIKMVVLSRNLTFDDSLDIVVSMTGKVTGTEQSKRKHAPIISLVEWVNRVACHDKKKKASIAKLCDSLWHVKEFVVDEPFDDYDFFTFNRNLMNQDDVMEGMQGRDMIVFSPFIDEKTLGWLFEKANRKHLVTRRESITERIHDIMGTGNIYAVNESLIQDEETSVDLHAKMYFVSKDSNNYLYLGSANATNTAFNRNTELLLRLHFIPRKASFDKFKEMTLGEEENQYVPVEGVFDGPGVSVMSEEEKIFNEVIRNIEGASAKLNGSCYDVSVRFKKDSWPVSAKILPLQNSLNKVSIDITKNTVLKGMPLKDLSDFYVIMVGKGKEQVKSVVKIETDGIPAERDNVIFQSIVDTENKFVNYVSFLLTENPQEFIYAEETQRKFEGNGKGTSHDAPVMASLYEDLLRIVNTEPERLRIVEQDLDKFGNKVPEAFKSMFAVFKESLKYLR